MSRPPRLDAPPEVLLAAKVWCGVQLLGLAIWWTLMLGVDGAAALFVPEEMGSAAVWAFALPDTALVASLSIYALVQLNDLRPAARTTFWFIAGAQAYPTLWAVVATLMTDSAWAGPALMLPVWGICLNVAWTLQPRESWFRVAAPSTPARNAARTIAQALLFNVVFLALLPALMVGAERDIGVPRLPTTLLFWPAVGLIVALNLGGLLSGVVLAVRGEGTPLPVQTAGKLVVTGPYAHIRNPMAAVGIAQGVLLGLGLGSVPVIAYSLLGAAVWHFFARPIEEVDLLERFGEPYRAYRSAVPLWYPQIRAYEAE